MIPVGSEKGQRAPRRFPGDPGLVRADDWWNDKIPHLVAFAAIGLATRTWSTVEGIVALGLFLVSAIGVAAFGHVVNDLTDISDDAAAGKPNRLGPVRGPTRVALLSTCLVVGLVPWIWLPRTTLALALLGTEVLLLLAYSVPPVRLKNRAGAGVVADALYAYSVPMLLAVAVFATSDARSAPVLCGIGVYGLLVGARGIVWHQVQDQDQDRASGVQTLVTRVGERRALAVVDALAPVEVAVLAVMVLLASSYADSPAIAITCALYVPWRLFQIRYLWSSPLSRGGAGARGAASKLLGYGVSMGVLERWLPVVALVVLSWRDPWWWPVTIAYLLAFRTAVSEFVHDAPQMLDGVARLLAEPAITRTTRRVRDERTEAIAAATDREPEHSTGSRGPTSGRWVFVLCGTDVHTGTMRTALRHLSPLTNLEIWVVTDLSRNEEAIDATTVTGLVDVRAPEHLDDHQAAIWLKTSVHRHLPPGTWCYLDTDIVGVAPGVDEIFRSRSGPVTFAADMPLAVNSIDHFSPFAMNCGCLERGLLQCEHLRLQLSDRLDVRVPADWCHWNGGVFVFGTDGHALLDRWHELAVESFDWPEWRTRDQGALIAAAWQLDLQDLPLLPPEFNFIVADPWNNDVYLDRRRGWSLGPDGPWIHPRMLHLFQSGLEEPDWDLSRDVEGPIIRRTLQIERVAEFADWRSARWWDLRIRVGNSSRRLYWTARKSLEFARARVTRTARRLRPRRMVAAARRRARGRSGSKRVTNR